MRSTILRAGRKLGEMSALYMLLTHRLGRRSWKPRSERTLGRLKQQDTEVAASLGYTASLRQPEITEDAVSQKEQMNIVKPALPPYVSSRLPDPGLSDVPMREDQHQVLKMNNENKPIQPWQQNCLWDRWP